jgi:hypothetical protein
VPVAVPRAGPASGVLDGGQRLPVEQEAEMDDDLSCRAPRGQDLTLLLLVVLLVVLLLVTGGGGGVTGTDMPVTARVG